MSGSLRLPRRWLRSLRSPRSGCGRGRCASRSLRSRSRPRRRRLRRLPSLVRSSLRSPWFCWPLVLLAALVAAAPCWPSLVAVLVARWSPVAGRPVAASARLLAVGPGRGSWSLLPVAVVLVAAARCGRRCSLRPLLAAVVAAVAPARGPRSAPRRALARPGARAAGRSARGARRPRRSARPCSRGRLLGARAAGLALRGPRPGRLAPAGCRTGRPLGGLDGVDQLAFSWRRRP